MGNKPENDTPAVLTARTKFCDAVDNLPAPGQAQATREVMHPAIPRVAADDLMHPYGLD